MKIEKLRSRDTETWKNWAIEKWEIQNIEKSIDRKLENLETPNTRILNDRKIEKSFSISIIRQLN